jgi:hypothetical protein
MFCRARSRSRSRTVAASVTTLNGAGDGGRKASPILLCLHPSILPERLPHIRVGDVFFQRQPMSGSDINGLILPVILVAENPDAAVSSRSGGEQHRRVLETWTRLRIKTAYCHVGQVTNQLAQQLGRAVGAAFVATTICSAPCVAPLPPLIWFNLLEKPGTHMMMHAVWFSKHRNWECALILQVSGWLRAVPE